PSILSVFLGHFLDKTMNCIEKSSSIDADFRSKILSNFKKIPNFLRENTDRNRTSPFAFTGNKFEFRAVGSSQNCATPMTVLNIVVADSIDKMLELIKKYQKTEKSFEVAVLRSIKDVLARTRDIRFEKDGYSKEWQREAKKRGLYTNNRLLTALGELVVDKNINLFAKYDILTEVELRSRFSAWSNLYNTNKMIEINVLLEMLENSVIPDIIAYRTFIINSLKDTKGVLEAALVRGERNLLKEYAELISKLFTKKDELVAYKKIFKNKEELSGINYVYENINPIIADIKDILDKLEKRTGEKYWSLLKYKDLLFF
ncbi:MAG: hypothetical protein LBG48_04885, partial [Rickettsiales bacterium]|nr:hypothetical protein [Rickettsiales bacterium]